MAKLLKFKSSGCSSGFREDLETNWSLLGPWVGDPNEVYTMKINRYITM